jgi:hypothetical protein
MRRESLSKALVKPHVKALVDECQRQAIEQLEAASLAVLGNLLRNAGSEHVQKDIALKVLAKRLEPEQQGNVTNVNVGYVVRLDKPNASHALPNSPSRQAEDIEPLADQGNE